MKVKLFKSVFVIAIAMLGGINVFNTQKKETWSDVAMANVEALADYEWVNGKVWTCYHYVSDDVSQEVFSIVKYCGDCSSCSATETKN